VCDQVVLISTHEVPANLMAGTRSTPSKSRIWANPSASSFQYTKASDLDQAQKFHSNLPGFQRTPLVALEDLAAGLGLKGVFVKDESSRLGLPSFKILGASWGTFRALSDLLDVKYDVDIDELAAKARDARIKLIAATDGNHGRAVARMAKLMRLEADIYVPKVMDESTENFITGEGAKVIRVNGDYNAAVAMASKEASGNSTHVLIQDTSFEGYETIPKWIVEGYSTLLMETEFQLHDRGLEVTTIITPVGVGSLAHAVVSFAKCEGRTIHVAAVEPCKAACLHNSLKTGDTSPITTTETIMAGMNCGSVSPMSWPLLKKSIDVSVTVSEWEAHQAVRYLQKNNVDAGPCGAATLAALRRIAEEDPDAVGLNGDSVVVLLSTEGTREYRVPSEGDQ
jgi:diaminopropionate ammonia-lyase family